MTLVVSGVLEAERRVGARSGQLHGRERLQELEPVPVRVM
jgi:hypothetical protein